MIKKLAITDDYIYIPVYVEKETEHVNFYIENESGKKQVFEFRIPVSWEIEGEYEGNYLGELPVHAFVGETMVIEGNIPENMAERIINSGKIIQKTGKRPSIHFAPVKGWVNDPNGMVYKDGVYHLYFQQNPFDTRWNNMSWGHATSKDLLHWEQHDSVMFPDSYGHMYSGCGLVNERSLLGLPDDALLFFYTAAGGMSQWCQGKEFTQKIAYSLDNGNSLIKIDAAAVETVYVDNRDPKIFWHEETQAYIMVLWLRGYRFGIFRSYDLETWEHQQELFLEEGWECPDLFCLKNKEGEEKWFFWTASGLYYPGEFDGFQFMTTGERHQAYITGVPYANQTFSGVEGRTISIPWLRMPHDGRLFAGAYGIPVELTYEDRRGWSFIRQKPVREFYEALTEVSDENITTDGNVVTYHASEEHVVFDCKVELDPMMKKTHTWVINGSEVKYNPITGDVEVDGAGYRARIECPKIEFIVDDRILEIFFDDGTAMGIFVLKESELSFSLREDKTVSYRMFELK